MTPQLGWNWLSEAERRAAELALSDYGDEGARDELGFGVIHFAYADRFFPGTSVLHQSIRYVWCVVWAYQELAEGRGDFDDDRLRAIETRTGRKLLRYYGEGDGNGIIGVRLLRRRKSPATRPSRLYWNAVKTWGLVNPLARTGLPPTQSELQTRWSELVAPEVALAELEATRTRLFADPPQEPDGWRSEKPLSFELDGREADRLRAGWRSVRRGDERTPCLMSRLADAGGPVPEAMTSPRTLKLCGAAEAAALGRSRRAAALVCVGRALHGLMAEDARDGDGRRQARDDLDEAVRLHATSALELDLGLLCTDVPGLGRLEDLLAAVQAWLRGGSQDYASLRTLFEAREVALKGERALLHPRSSRLADWSRPAPQPLTYRWDRVRRFLEELAST